MAEAIANSTTKAYTSAFRSWSRFCTETHGISCDPLVPDEESLTFFAAHCKSREHRPLTHGTVHKYFYGIRSILLGEGYTFCSFAEMPKLEAFMRGWKKSTYATRRKPRLPITVAMLHLLLPFVEDSPAGRVIWAAMCTGVYGLFRSGELSAKSARAKAYPRISH